LYTSFFFQAEDGIRGFHVTGVQTCALPIFIASTTAAADLLGVGRSALSNLLNGHADLWPEMALRIEKAFGVRMDTLLAMQLAHEIGRASCRGRGQGAGRPGSLREEI